MYSLGCPHSSCLIMPVALALAHCMRQEQEGEMCGEEIRKRKRQACLKAVERAGEPRSYKLRAQEKCSAGAPKAHGSRGSQAHVVEGGY